MINTTLYILEQLVSVNTQKYEKAYLQNEFTINELFSELKKEININKWKNYFKNTPLMLAFFSTCWWIITTQVYFSSALTQPIEKFITLLLWSVPIAIWIGIVISLFTLWKIKDYNNKNIYSIKTIIGDNPTFANIDEKIKNIEKSLNYIEKYGKIEDKEEIINNLLEKNSLEGKLFFKVLNIANKDPMYHEEELGELIKNNLKDSWDSEILNILQELYPDIYKEYLNINIKAPEKLKTVEKVVQYRYEITENNTVNKLKKLEKITKEMLELKKEKELDWEKVSLIRAYNPETSISLSSFDFKLWKYKIYAGIEDYPAAKQYWYSLTLKVDGKIKTIQINPSKLKAFGETKEINEIIIDKFTKSLLKE